MKTLKGIDASKHQGLINWGHVTADFAIIRVGYGKEISQKDIQFENNYAGCKSNSIPVGAYWYSYALTTEDAKKEAETCLKIIKGKTFEYPIYFDIEDPSQTKLSKSQITAIVKTFCSELEKAGYFVGIYSFASFLNAYLDDEVKERYAVWVAHTGVSEPNYKKAYGMWQYSHTGQINGVFEDVDLNYCYVDYPTIIKKAGLNGFSKKTVNIKKEETKEEKTYKVKSGDTLTAIAKKYSTTVDKIVADNKKTYPKITRDYIQVGWTLKV